jgi:proteasome lid subunit RPN8/RPN11
MSEVRFGSWSVAESPVAIEYSLVVIEEIRHEVAEGFQRLSRGGMEVGGVLYGTRDGRTVTVLAMRPMACEHARGPAFLLSDQDRSILAEQLEHEGEDPRLEGLTCVGWFLSHTRSEILLSDSDLEIFRDCFGAPWQVTLVIRPGRGGSMRAGFFVREADGTVKSESSYLEFNFPDRLAGVLDRSPRVERHAPERRSLGGHARAAEAAAPVPFRRESPQSMPSLGPGPQLLPAPPPRSKWPWLVAWAVVVLALAFFGVRAFVLSPRTDPIALSVLEHDGQLQIQWNHTARSVTGASAGTLDIADGKDARHVPLSPQDLAKGSFTYQRNTGEVEVRMAVEDAQGKKIEERSQYLGSAPAKVDSQEMRDLQQQKDALQAEVDQLRRSNGAQAERIQELERAQKILETRLGIK